MTDDRSLAEAFLAGLPADPSRPDIDAAELLDVLNSLLESAQSTWPTVAMAPEVFFSHLAGKVRGDGALDGVLNRMPVADLYLACACAQGNTTAILTFEDAYLRGIDTVLTKLDIPRSLADDVKQTLRQRLLVADGERAPRIADYNGSGDLRSWVGVVAMREAVHRMRKASKEVALTDELISALPSTADDLELEYQKKIYRDEFRDAFGDGITALSRRQRNLLRQQFLYGLTIDQIGSIYRVHRSTAARWIEKARDKLLAETRRSLMKRLRISRSEFESIMSLIQSRLDVSVRRYLSEDD